MTNVAFSQNMFRLGVAWAWLLLNNFSTILHLCARRSDAVLATTVWLGRLAAIICKLARHEGSVSALGAWERCTCRFFLAVTSQVLRPLLRVPFATWGRVGHLAGLFKRPVVSYTWFRSYFSPLLIGSRRFFYEILSCLKQLHLASLMSLYVRTPWSLETLWSVSPLPSRPPHRIRDVGRVREPVRVWRTGTSQLATQPRTHGIQICRTLGLAGGGGRG